LKLTVSTFVATSTVGRILAARLQRPLIDSDEAVERRAGRTVREIFRRDGEAAFRELEREVFAEALQSSPPAVIAAAGGVVLDERNRAALRASSAKVVWLSAEPAALVPRVTAAGHRPLLDDDPARVLEEMCAARQPLYREVAHLIVSVDGRTPAEVAEAVLR
jgi:shikimate kinase